MPNKQDIMAALHFKDPEKAREYLERVRWPDGPVCPHCGGFKKIYKLQGKSTRPGVYKCGYCRRQFTVTAATVLERSKIPLHIWLKAAYLLCSSTESISTHQLHKIVGISYKSAWLLTRRIRGAMAYPNFSLDVGR